VLRRALMTAGVMTVLAVPAAQAKTTITMSGSTSVAPLVRALASKYVALNPGKVSFKLQQGGSDIGIKPQPSDPGGLVFNRIAYDAICVITSTANPLTGLSQAQVQSIFTGRTRSWSEVPGARVRGAIDIFTRTATSGTADAFREIFLGASLSVAASAPAKSSNGLVNQAVRIDDNAIGFVSLDFLSGVVPVPYQGVACNLRNAKSGQYQGVRPFSLVTRGAATGAAKTFINWAQHSSQAKAIINTHWIPLR
jgi:phosphate transport system substrate-binding protein